MSKSRELMVPILMIMFEGWKLHEASYTTDGPNKHGYTRNKIDCMVEVAKERGYDALTGYLIYLFDHWGNDIQGVSAYYGVGWDKDGNVTDQLPPYPGTDNPLETLEISEYSWCHSQREWKKNDRSYDKNGKDEAVTD